MTLEKRDNDLIREGRIFEKMYVKNKYTKFLLVAIKIMAPLFLLRIFNRVKFIDARPVIRRVPSKGYL